MFKEKLKSLRKDNNLTQVELADKLFVSRSLIARWEYGDIYPTMENLKKIAEYFDIPLNDLLRENEKTELIIHQANLERKTRKGLRISILSLIIIYSIIVPMLYFFKIFSITCYDFSNDIVNLKVFHYSIIDCINPNSFWLIITSIILNLILIILSVLTFSIKKKRIKTVLSFATCVLVIISIIFMILTFVIGNKDPINILPKTLN